MGKYFQRICAGMAQKKLFSPDLVKACLAAASEASSSTV
jgi:hypothetical protein